MFWPGAAASGKFRALEIRPAGPSFVGFFNPMSPESVHSLLTLGFGFAVAGLLASLYQLVTARPASFQILSARPHPSTIVTLPFVIFVTPFLIMRNTIRGQQMEGGSFGFAMLATMVAGFWSLMSGELVMCMIETLSRLFA